jgi:membrane peptidoglycan carboxypeptidase
MVPSLASAIGSSGDSPSALAELMGIILNNGVRLPRSSIEQLHFGEGTPYETIFERKPGDKEQVVFSPEVAQVLRAALVDVVENGTARRLKGQIKLADGTVLVVGGKTGTGDHQFKTFSPGGALLSSKVISRTATFVFFIGDRFFGAVSAHVKGEKSGDYEFTSALAAEVLKAASPALLPLLESEKL